jgi:hypothetical protein
MGGALPEGCVRLFDRLGRYSGRARRAISASVALARHVDPAQMALAFTASAFRHVNHHWRDTLCS